MTEIISVRFRTGGKEYYFDPKGVKVKLGDQVIIETAKGPEFGTCCRGNSFVPDDKVVQPLRPMLRLATDRDRETIERNRQREKEAFDVCEAKIGEYGLEMELVRCECAFDGSKLLFFFTSEGRVDFRALVKDLASTLHSRIELRQIGVRDESKLLGGLGICGRPYCCNAFLDQFHPVSIKMAKTQGLSLNPAKISGACGRLMCCLKYEQDAYEDAVKRLPKKESFVETPDGAGTVSEVNFLRETVKIRLESIPEEAQVYTGEEIRVIRSGKGPRPEGYVAPPQAELEKLRKVTPRLVQPEPVRETASYAEERRSRGEGERRAARRSQDKPRQEGRPKQDKPRQEGASSGQGDKAKEGRSRNRRRHRGGGGKGKGPSAQG